LSEAIKRGNHGAIVISSEGRSREVGLSRIERHTIEHSFDVAASAESVWDEVIPST
jgi:hypothetical protein